VNECQFVKRIESSELENLTACLGSFIPGCGGVREASGFLTPTGAKVSLLGVKHIANSVAALVNKLGIVLPSIVSRGLDQKCDAAEEISRVFNCHGSDKCVSHDYQLVYAEVFKQMPKEQKLSILEVGLGTQNRSLPSHMHTIFKPGSSLRALKELFPSADVFGADIDRDILFQEDRITTAYVDQLDFGSFAVMQRAFGNPVYDLVIEDGLHSITASLNTLVFALSVTRQNGFIVLEDLTNYDDSWRIITAALLACGHNAELVNSNGLCLVVQVTGRRFV